MYTACNLDSTKSWGEDDIFGISDLRNRRQVRDSALRENGSFGTTPGEQTTYLVHQIWEDMTSGL